jgi:hypothetical protein
VLRADVLDEPVEPRDERGPRLLLAERVGGADERLDLADVDGLDQVVAGREVAVQRADADLRAAGDVLERRIGAVLRERVARRGQQRLVVPQGVGPPRLLRRDRVEGGGHRDLPGCKRRHPPLRWNP